MLASLIVLLGLGAPASLIEDPQVWSCNTDSPGSTVTVDSKDGVLAATVVSSGTGSETFPKLIHRDCDTPQDWRRYARLNARLRVTSDDPAVKSKSIAFVFYDEQTRRTDLPDNPMAQQVIHHSIPVGEWVELQDWLGAIHRTAIRRLVVYIYELPPPDPHTYRWEFARLELEKVNGDADVMAASVKPNAPVPDVAARLATDDGLELSLATDGTVATIDLEKAVLGNAGTVPTGLLVRDAGADGPAVRVGGALEQDQGAIQQTARLDDLGLAVSATYRAAGPFLEIQGTVSDTRGQDRAVTVYFAVPVIDAPWQWWDSVAAKRTEDADGEPLACFEGAVEYGLRGEHSKYPLGAISSPGHGGLTLAIRMDEPVVHRIAYIPRLRLFYIAFDFGLIPEARVQGRALSEAPFRFLLYSHDPAWGFRSALQRYYGFFPDFFTKRVKREGGWYVWGNMKDTPEAQKAGFGFHWGPSGAEAVRYDNESGFLTLSYIEPEMTQVTMGDFKQAPTVEEALSRIHKLAEGDEGELANRREARLRCQLHPGKVAE